MNLIKQKARSFYAIVILFLLILAIQVVMYGNFFHDLREGADAITDLSRVRGAIQRYAKLELAGVNPESSKLAKEIDGLITLHMKQPSSDKPSSMSQYYDLHQLRVKWDELKFLTKEYHANPDRDHLLSVIDKSEECWVLADTYVIGRQYITDKTETSFRYFTVTLGLNLFIIMLALLLYKKLILNNMASSAASDSLTQVFNRGYFDEYLEHEIARSHRKQALFSLVMLDIDRFKLVNDTYGHRRGDYALKTLAEIVGKCKRNSDVLARIGGEEFIVLLPDTGLAQAVQLAERIRKSVEDYSFEEIGKMTISLGITEFLPTDDKESILKRVDSAMYRAKQNGRNRCESIRGEEDYESKSFSDRT